MGANISLGKTVNKVSDLLKKAAVNSQVEGGLDNDDLGAIKRFCMELFRHYDKDGNGVLERKEMDLLAKDLDKYLTRHHRAAAVVTVAALNDADADNTNSESELEATAAANAEEGSVATALITHWDKDGSKTLTKDEFIIGIVSLSKQLAVEGR